MSTITATEEAVANRDSVTDSPSKRDRETITAEYREALRASDYAVLKLRNLITYIPHYEEKGLRIAVRALDVARLIATTIQEEPVPLGTGHSTPIRFEDLVNPMYYTVVKPVDMDERTIQKPRYHDALHKRLLPSVSNSPEDALQGLRTDDEGFEQTIVQQVDETLQQLRNAYQSIVSLARELTHE